MCLVYLILQWNVFKQLKISLRIYSSLEWKRWLETWQLRWKLCKRLAKPLC